MKIIHVKIIHGTDIYLVDVMFYTKEALPYESVIG